MTRWGIVTTLRGTTTDILQFVAYHLDLGPDCIHIYLDEPNPKAFNWLNRHPKVEVRNCDASFWSHRHREKPEKHQVRQTANATLTYRRSDLDWLAHIDIDEFLWPDRPIAQILGSVPDDVVALRVRPLEALAHGADLYKTYIPTGQNRDGTVQSIYPNYGAFVPSGFLSHIQGKVFARVGLPKISFRIHNLYQNGEVIGKNPEPAEIELCHRHAPDWDHFLAHYKFRLERGSYQPGMSPNFPREMGGMNKNELLSWIEAEDGTSGLRAFFDEISGVDPQVRNRLDQLGMIRHRPLDLDAKLRKHFPGSI